VLEVQIAGRLDVTRLQVIVDPEGTVNIPPLGAVRVGGLTLLEANRQISERARTLLRFSDVSVSVASPRAFEVVISGEVERPGTVSAMAMQRLHEVILGAGGITPRGSVRRVQVMRANERRASSICFASSCAAISPRIPTWKTACACTCRRGGPRWS
jgi:protein involved in polysaccharide export with SLBB domain